MTDQVSSRGPRIAVRGVAVGILTVLLAAILARAAADLGPGSGVAIFMLAVTVAAAIGGLWGGGAAAIVASVVLPFIEQPDQPAFDDAIDLIAAVVFLAIAVLVGLLVGNAADERDLAARREREARLLALLSTRLSGDLPERVLDDFVQALMEPFGLAVCRVQVTLDGHEVSASAEVAERVAGGPREIVPIVVANAALGTLVAERPDGAKPFSRDDRLLLDAATRQAAVALDRARLDARARLAQVDAETNQLRAAMFSSVTHDLRTPLASIKAGVTSLLDESAPHDPAQQRELLLTMLEETDRLNRLVGNILDLAKIRAGALLPRRMPTAVDEVAETVVGRLAPRMRADGVKVALTFPPDLPVVPADPMQVDQVLTNLVENAARHSPPDGTVRITLNVVPRAVRARVSDEGPGIPAEDREKVFEAFYRGGESPESAGSGLGLAIAKAIVSAHGGRIWVEQASEGGGTSVAFELPFEESVVL
ncbi:MAG TPA: ATP-binding protein [Actinomycetota bacterium]